MSADRTDAVLHAIDRRAASGVAKAEAQHQMTRPFARYLLATFNEAQRDRLRILLSDAVVNAIEAWEQGRESREREKFYADI